MMRFFSELFSQNWSTKVISIITALVLWVVVLGSQNIEITKDIPVEIVPSEELLPTGEILPSVNVRLSGPKAFLRTITERKEAPIRVNLRGTKPGIVTYRFMPEDFKIPLGVKILWIQPPVLSIKLETPRVREIPVRAELRGQPPEGYRIGRVDVEPRSVRIRATRSRLEGLTELVSLPVDISDLLESTEKTLSFDLPVEEVQLASTPPKVKIQVIPSAPNFRIRNIPLKIQSTLKAKPSVSHVTVFVRASSEDLKALDSSKVTAEIDLRGFGSGTHRRAVKVTLPKKVALVRVAPSQVQVELE